MIYQLGMLCKHFKGKTLEDKNIYRIIKIGVAGKEINTKDITYTGDGELVQAKNLVIYANIFQENKLFAREYEDISSELPLDKQKLFFQKLKVQPLTEEETTIVNSPQFIKLKEIQTKEKYQ